MFFSIPLFCLARNCFPSMINLWTTNRHTFSNKTALPQKDQLRKGVWWRFIFELILMFVDNKLVFLGKQFLAKQKRGKELNIGKFGRATVWRLLTQYKRISRRTPFYFRSSGPCWLGEISILLFMEIAGFTKEIFFQFETDGNGFPLWTKENSLVFRKAKAEVCRQTRDLLSLPNQQTYS